MSKLPISPYDMPLWENGPTEREIQREWNKTLNEHLEKMLLVASQQVEEK